MKKQALFLTAVVGLSIGASEVRAAENFRMLVINQVGAWPHTGAINELKTRLNSLATAMNFGIKHVDANAAALMVADTLKNYDVMFWNNNTSIGAVITAGAPRNAFQAWLKEGHGLVAQHGVMDHADLWPWLTDSVLGGTRFTQHSGWNSSTGKNAKVKWDDLATSGEVRSNKAEYAKIKANIPGSATSEWFTYPDEWYSFTLNPRAKVDVLMRIDETTYDVPEKMGTDHPIAWAYHMPATTPGGKQGRFIYNARGHEAPAFSGTGSGAAPNDAWGTANSPTYGFIKYSICWAAGATGKIDEDCKPIVTNAIGAKAVAPGKMLAAAHNGSLVVNVKGQGRFDIQIFDVAGQRVARKTGVEGEFAFPELKSGSMYIVKARDGANRDHVQRVAF